MLGIDPAPHPLPSHDPPSSPPHKQDHSEQPISSAHPLILSTPAIEKRKSILRATERIALAIAVVVVAILFPDFGAVMAFLGAFSAFMLCVIGPICAKAALERHMGIVDRVLLVIAVGMAAAGTWVSFKTGSGA
jgi:vesicular inhibitory amino acid transporter